MGHGSLGMRLILTCTCTCTMLAIQLFRHGSLGMRLILTCTCTMLAIQLFRHGSLGMRLILTCTMYHACYSAICSRTQPNLVSRCCYSYSSWIPNLFGFLYKMAEYKVGLERIPDYLQTEHPDLSGYLCRNQTGEIEIAIKWQSVLPAFLACRMQNDL